MGRIIAVCKSRKKGIKKDPVSEGVFKENYGLIGDAHADSNTHRQVSLLAMESIEKMHNLGLAVGPGDFAENLTIEGVNLVSLPIGTRIFIGGEVILEVAQIGKECHAACDIRRKTGECIMPDEGMFARVIRGGWVKAGDELSLGE